MLTCLVLRRDVNGNGCSWCELSCFPPPTQSLERATWDALVQQLTSQDVDYSALPPEALSQLFQAQQMQLALHPGTDWPLPPALLEPARESWVANTRNIT